MRRILGVILYVPFLLPCMLAMFFTLGVGVWAFDRQFYLNLVSEEQVYQVFLESDFANVVNADWERSATTQSDQIGRAYALAFREVVDAPYLRQQVVNVVNEFFDFFDDSRQFPALAIDLQPVKQTLMNDETKSAAFARTLAANLPVCGDNQSPSAAQPTPLTAQTCRPADQSVEQFTATIRNGLQGYVETLPNTWALNTEIPPSTAELSGFSLRNVLVGTLIGGLVVCAVGWVVTALLASGRARGRWLWLGWMLIIPSAVVLLTGTTISNAVVTSVVNSVFYDGTLTINGVPASGALRASLTSVTLASVNAVGRGFLLVGGVGVGVGLALLALGVLTRRDDDGFDDGSPSLGGGRVAIPKAKRGE